MEEKKTIRSLGLRVSATGISWALVDYETNRKKNDKGEFLSKIVDTGCREIPLTVKEKQSFERAEANKEAADRHLRRSARRNRQRYRQRRDRLESLLGQYGMLAPSRDIEAYPRETLELRAKAVTEEITLHELGKVLMHINKRRGFKSNRKDDSKEGKETEYKAAIKQRNLELKEKGLTVGQWLVENAKIDPTGRTKSFVFYRKDHEDEFDRIWETQKCFHPVLDDEKLKRKLKKTVIFYQRDLKSQKHLIANCPFESRPVTVTQDGKTKTRLQGPKVAPRSSPLYQEYRMWCDLSNIRVTDLNTGQKLGLSTTEMQTLADKLRYTGKMKATQVLKALKMNPKKMEISIQDEGIMGNATLSAFRKAALAIAQGRGYIAPKSAKDEVAHLIEALKGYGISTNWLTPDFTHPSDENFHTQPAMMLWHLLHSYRSDNRSADGSGGLKEKICDICKVTEAEAELIADLSLQDSYGAFSSKAIAKLLPYLREGLMLHEAETICEYKRNNIYDSCDGNPLQRLDKNALRNPTAEKIINQVLGLVEAIERLHGKPQRIVLESDRILKMSRKRRKAYNDGMKARKADNDRITAILKKNFGISYPSHADIEKYRLYQELEGNGYRTLYSDRLITPDMLFGQSGTVNIDHILPKHLFFDESSSNRTLEFKDVNEDKGHTTALDYIIQTQGEEGEKAFREKVESLYRSKAITETKKNRLLTRFEDIPKDVIEERTQSLPYALKVLRMRLDSYADDVIVTLPEITSKIVKEWRLQSAVRDQVAEAYEAYGLTEERFTRNGDTYVCAPSWKPAEDPRSGITAAVAAAFTKRSWIQYLNTLSAQDEPDNEAAKIREEETVSTGNGKIFIPPMPLDVLYESIREFTASTLVSIRTQNNIVSIKTNCTPSMRSKGKTQRTLVPRGRLHAETVRGLRTVPEPFTMKVGSGMTEKVAAMVNSKTCREALLKRLAEHGGNPTLAFCGANSVKKKPVWLDDLHIEKVPEEVACTRKVPVFTIRKRITPELFKGKHGEPDEIFSGVFDPKARKLLINRYEEKSRDLNAAFGNLIEEPIWMDHKHTKMMLSVTLYEKQKGTVPLRRDDGRMKDFVNPEGNHHLALYKDRNGFFHSRVTTFMETVERAVKGLPPIDKEYNADKGWEYVVSFKKNEMFVLPGEGFDPNGIDLTDPQNRKLISPHLFRVQALGENVLRFRHHCNRKSTYDNAEKQLCWQVFHKDSEMAKAVKVHIDRTGRIISSGESHIKA